MARTVRNARLDSRTARLRLAPRNEPYWAKITKGCYLGYRRSVVLGGSWIARYRDATGDQRYTALGPADDVMDPDGATVLSFDQAQAKARTWFQNVAAVFLSGQTTGPYTVADCITDYIAWAKTHRESAAHMETYAKAYILPRLGHVDTAALTTPIIRRWHEEIAAERPRLRRRKGQPIRYREEDPDPEEAQRKRRLRANRHLTTLRAALNRAWREGRIATRDAWERVELFRDVERPRLRFLAVDEAQRLLNACPPDLRDLVHLALLTGARYGELCRLDVRDVQSASGTLFIRKSKSGKSRHVVLNAEGDAFCRRLTTGRPPTQALLLRDDGTRWSRDLHRRPFKEAVVRAGIEAAFTFHELRHTWASLTIMAGAPLIVVAQNLGHCDTRMVERHYGHLTRSYVAEVVRKTAPSFGLGDATTVVPLGSPAG